MVDDSDKDAAAKAFVELTQVELDRIHETLLKQYLSGYDEEPGAPTWNTGTFTHPDVSPKAECTHEYKTYTGLTESYEYCTKCDKKHRE